MARQQRSSQFEEYPVSEPNRIAENHVGEPPAAAAHVGQEGFEMIGNHIGEDDNISVPGSTTEFLQLTNYVSLGQLMNPAFLPLKLSAAQAQVFQRSTRNSDGDQELTGDTEHAQITKVLLKGYRSALPIAVCPVVAVQAKQGVQKLRPPHRRGLTIVETNGSRYPITFTPMGEIDHNIRGGFKRPPLLFENSSLLDAQFVKRWQGVNVATLDRGVYDIPGTTDKLLDLDENDFYPASLYRHQHLLEEDVPDFNYEEIYLESMRRAKGRHRVRVPAAALERLKDVMLNKGIQEVKAKTISLVDLGVAVENPIGEAGSFAQLHAQLHNQGIDGDSDVRDILNKKFELSVLVEISAVVH